MRLDPPRGPAGLRAPTARMRLVLQANGVPEGQMPEAIAAYKLSPEDAALSPQAVRKLLDGI